MSAQGSTVKESNISSIRDSNLAINQNTATINIPPSKNLPKNTKNLSSSSSGSSDFIAINIDRQGQATCSICLGDYLPKELKTPLKCKHAFCSACLTEYLTVKINNNEVLDIPCPQSGCVEIFTEKSVKKIIPSKEFKKYQDLVQKKMMLRGPKKTYCPQPGCSRPVKLAEGQESTRCICGAKICNACLKLYHEGKTCFETRDPAFEKYAKENGVRFCMICKTIVIKETGCNTIKCAVCDYKWCWICGREDSLTHSCLGEWDPIPPASVRRKDVFLIRRFKKSWREGSTLKRIWICFSMFLLSPFLLLGLLIFYPFYDSFGPSLGLEGKKPLESVFIILGELLLGLIALPGTFALFIILTVSIGLFFPIFYLIEFLLRKLTKEPREPQVETRWHSRNPENFTYRPTDPHG